MEVKTRRRHRKSVLVPVLMLIIVGFAAFYVGTQYMQDSTPTIAVAPKSTPSVVVEDVKVNISEVIKGELADIGELATEEYYFTSLATFESNKKIKGVDVPFTTKTFIYSYDGVIKAGVNFNEITLDVDEGGKAVIITMPQAEILSTEIFEDSFLVYDESSNIFNPIKLEDMNASLMELKNGAKEDAVNHGVLDKAVENGKTVLKSFVAGIAGANGYTVIVK